MAVKMRLRREGKKKQPFYRVVVADVRSPRDGRFIEDLGYYHPLRNPSEIQIDKERALHWLRNGVQPSQAVVNLLRIEGIWEEFKPGSAAEGEERRAKRAAKRQAQEERLEAARKQQADDAAEAARKRNEAAEAAAKAEAEPEAGADAEAGDAAADSPGEEVSTGTDEQPAEEAAQTEAADEAPASDTAETTGDAPADEAPAADAPEAEAPAEEESK